ncbi:MAG: DNA-binding protein [Euryarchaeota archaeon]|nr:DNA-binding protein [Euryarchaeota archaeon]
MEESIEDIKKKKLEEMKKRREIELQKAQEEQQQELQIQSALRQILTSEARARLNRVKIAKPEFAKQVQMQLIQMAQSGKLQEKLTDKKLKSLLKSLQQRKPSFNITRK